MNKTDKFNKFNFVLNSVFRNCNNFFIVLSIRTHHYTSQVPN